MIHQFPSIQHATEPAALLCGCEHRAVSKDGRIVCAKITQGDNTISPDVCRGCPAHSINCSHLRFSLNHSQHVPLVVRFNGHTEVWSDDAPELRFQHAACEARVTPILHAKACANCPLRMAAHASGDAAQADRLPACGGKIVPLPAREHILAAS